MQESEAHQKPSDLDLGGVPMECSLPGRSLSMCTIAAAGSSVPYLGLAPANT